MVVFVTLWFSIVRVLLFQLSVELLPLLVEGLSIFLVLLHCEHLLLLGVHPQSLFEGKWIYLLQDGLQSYQAFLQDPITL